MRRKGDRVEGREHTILSCFNGEVMSLGSPSAFHQLCMLLEGGNRQHIWIQEKKVCTGVFNKLIGPEMFNVPVTQSFTNECHFLCIDKNGHNLMEFWEAAALPSR